MEKVKFDVQEKFFRMILKQLEQNTLSHAYLIELNDFIDVDYFLNIFVKLLLCPNKRLDAHCSNCKICKLVDAGTYPDVKIIDTDGDFIKKEQLLQVKEDFSSKSMYDNRQIYVIKDASKLNLSSGNTMLKFLEEPEDHIIAILLTKNRYNVLETILSRCQIYSLENSSELEIDLDLCNLIKTLFSKNKAFLEYNQILSIIPDRVEAKSRLYQISKYFFLVLHHEKELLSEIADLKEEEICCLLLIIEKYLNRFDYNLNYKLALDSLIVEINEVVS